MTVEELIDQLNKLVDDGRKDDEVCYIDGDFIVYIEEVRGLEPREVIPGYRRIAVLEGKPITVVL